MRSKRQVVMNACVLAVLMATSCSSRMPTDARVQELRKRRKLQQEYVREHAAKEGGSRMIQFFAGEEPGLLLAGTAPDLGETWGRLYADEGNGLWLTRDSGATWHAVTNGFGATRRVAAFAHDSERDLLYVASLGSGVSRSRDGGNSWEDYSHNLPRDTVVYGLALEPRSGMLTATVALNGVGAYLREPDAAGWRAIGEGIPAASAVVKELLPTENGVVALTGTGPVIIITGYKPHEFGLFRGTPHGEDYQWSRMRLPYHSKSFEAISVIRQRATGSLLAGGVAGVWEQTGKNWTCVLDEDFVSDMVVERGGRQRLLVRTADKLLLQEAGAWKPLEGTPWNPLAFVLQMQFTRGSIYVLTTDGLFFTGGDKGWTKVPAPQVQRAAPAAKNGPEVSHE